MTPTADTLPAAPAAAPLVTVPPASTVATKAPINFGDTGIQIRTLDEAYRFGQYVIKSGLAPKGFDTPEGILIALQHAAELGLSPMQGLQSVSVINGRPGIFGDTALALVRRSGLLESYSQKTEGEGDARRSTVTLKRKGEGETSSSFSVADAKKAGLWGKAGPWTQYPDRMLLFRARGFGLRDGFGDVLKGLRTVEELQDLPAEPRNVTHTGGLAAAVDGEPKALNAAAEVVGTGGAS